MSLRQLQLQNEVLCKRVAELVAVPQVSSQEKVHAPKTGTVKYTHESNTFDGRQLSTTLDCGRVNTILRQRPPPNHSEVNDINMEG